MNVAIIGTGTRSVLYLKQILTEKHKDIVIKALVDIDEEKLRRYAKDYFNDENMPALYTDSNEMMANEDIDTVFICTPDNKHTDIVLPILRAGKNVLLEKPMATTVEDCKAIYDESIKHGNCFYLGFVLRYTPLYKKVKEIIEAGTLGKIISVEAKEMLEYLHGASYMRRWHRLKENSGGFLNTKCCHDMDLLNWLVGSEPELISAFGSRAYFNPIAEAAVRCPDCKIKDKCRYYYKCDDYLEYNCVQDICVFNSDKDIYDHEVVNIQYENGVHASFTVTMLANTETRTLVIFGSDATLYADLTKNLVEVAPIGTVPMGEPNEGEPLPTVKYEIDVGGEGHFGGDAGIVNTMYEQISNGVCFRDARAGLMSSAMTLAAEKSIDEKVIVNVKEFIGLE